MYLDGDVASALSGNSIVGEKLDNELAETTDAEKYESKMLLFNGLYFRGYWAIPFQQLRSEEENYFHTSTTTKQSVKMIRSRGIFKSAKIASMNIEAIELPYENERYALLIVVPDSVDGLKDLIKQLNINTISEISQQLESDPIELSLPKFHVETTSRAEKAMGKVR